MFQLNKFYIKKNKYRTFLVFPSGIEADGINTTLCFLLEHFNLCSGQQQQSPSVRNLCQAPAPAQCSDGGRDQSSAV